MMIAPVDIGDERKVSEFAGSSSATVETACKVTKSTESISENVVGYLGVALFYGFLFGISCWNLWRVIGAIANW